MSFSELPTELHEQIVKHVCGFGERNSPHDSSVKSLLALSLTSKNLSSLAQWRLHERFRLRPGDNNAHQPSSTLIWYTRTLLERPDLAARVTHIDVALHYQYGWEIANEDYIKEISQEAEEEQLDNKRQSINVNERLGDDIDEMSDDDGASESSSGSKFYPHTIAELCEIEKWFQAVIAYGSKLQLRLLRYDGWQVDEIVTFLITKVPILHHLNTTWTFHTLDPVLRLANMVRGTDGAVNIAPKTGILQQRVPIPNILHSLKYLRLESDPSPSVNVLSYISPLLHLQSLEEIWVSNCIHTDSDNRFRLNLKPGSSNISSLNLIKSMVGPKTLQTLIAACRQLKTIRYSVCDFPSRHFWFAETASFIEVVAGLLPHSSHLETLKLDYAAVEPRSYSFGQIGTHLQPFTKLSKFAVNLRLLEGDIDEASQYLPQSLQSFSINGIYRNIDDILAWLKVLWDTKQLPDLKKVSIVSELVGESEVANTVVKFREVFDPIGIQVRSLRDIELWHVYG